MSEAKSTVRLVITTIASQEEGAQLGRTLVEEQLAACVTLVPGVLSIYPWKGALEDARETLLLIKTGVEQLEPLEARLHELHAYETPEFLVLDIAHASAPYLEWLRSCLKKA